MEKPVSSCKAWRFSSNGIITDSLKIHDIPIPSTPSFPSRVLRSLLKSYGPHPRILIRVAAASLNPVDYKMIYPGSAAFLVRKPGIPGSDFAGVVVCALDGGKEQLEALGLHVGMRVYGHLVTEWRMLLGTGTLSQYIVAYPPLILPMPPQLSFEECSSVFLAGITSWQALVKVGKLKAGQRVFINGGSSGTGVWAVQICKAMGAYVSTTCSESSREMLAGLSVDEVGDFLPP
ncbi:hypothetical protein M408DRAFT_152557 [Serendipita vermifera MAFF 305830]|uniref:Enoyl reductase (ER) domain-containing protein n=1 Tax=Serendipita vermifera MAFF 305830 TaxID=933852 RepID=A0A0C3B908_SERVB|nr:hypothetical protein M408DRAFT_152557 [Serendipita vermifera MAFF 305830]